MNIRKYPLLFLIALAVAGGGFLFFGFLADEEDDPFAVSEFTTSTAPSPFPGLPHATSSGVISSPKSDWTADETPEFKVDL